MPERGRIVAFTAALVMATVLGAGCLPGGRKKEAKPPDDPLHLAHRELAAALRESKVVHRPVLLNQCGSCHVSVEDVSRLRAGDPELCFGCHEDRKKDREKEHVHAAFLMECGTCHDKHGSDHPGMLSSPVNELCGACHEVAGDPLKKAHRGVTRFSGTCVRCHDPHASKNAKIIRETGLHPAFEGGMCESCHDAEGAGGKAKLTGSETETCGACHPDRVEGKKSAHAPVAGGSCTTCHDPHRSETYALLKDSAQALCRTCHPDVPRMGHPIGGHATGDEGDLMHPKDAKKPFGCASCHDQHGSDNPHLGRKPREELCQWCHAK